MVIAILLNIPSNLKVPKKYYSTKCAENRFPITYSCSSLKQTVTSCSIITAKNDNSTISNILQHPEKTDFFSE